MSVSFFLIKIVNDDNCRFINCNVDVILRSNWAEMRLNEHGKSKTNHKTNTDLPFYCIKHFQDFDNVELLTVVMKSCIPFIEIFSVSSSFISLKFFI